MDMPIMSEKEMDELAKTLASQGSLALHEKHPDLAQLRIGLHWEPMALSGHHVDMDIAALLLDSDGRVRGPEDFIFYNNARGADGAVRHSGDDRRGDKNIGAGDDETLLIDLSLVPPEIHKIAIVVSIHKAIARKQNFGLVRGASVRLINDGKGGEEIARLDLSEDVALATAAVVGELQRKDARNWSYIRVGLGDEGGLPSLLLDYGLSS